MAFKVGDRVRYHHAGHVGWFATVAKVCGSEVWLRDYSNGYPDDDEESDQAWCATYDFLPAPRYEQCGCVCEGRTANRRRESRGDWCGAQHPPMPAYVALDALTAGLRALSAEGAKPAKDSGGSAGAATRKDESLRAERDETRAEVERLRARETGLREWLQVRCEFATSDVELRALRAVYAKLEALKGGG